MDRDRQMGSGCVFVEGDQKRVGQLRIQVVVAGWYEGYGLQSMLEGGMSGIVDGWVGWGIGYFFGSWSIGFL